MITDMRSPDVIFGKGWEMFLLLIMQLTLERETEHGGAPAQPLEIQPESEPSTQERHTDVQHHPAQLLHPWVMVRPPFSAPF